MVSAKVIVPCSMWDSRGGVAGGGGVAAGAGDCGHLAGDSGRLAHALTSGALFRRRSNFLHVDINKLCLSLGQLWPHFIYLGLQVMHTVFGRFPS
jgi:hypothetical protein